MATLLNSVSPLTNPSLKSTRKDHVLIYKLPNHHLVSLRKGFSKILVTTQMSVTPKETFMMPDWTGGGSYDPRTRERELFLAYKHFEHMIKSGHKPDLTQGMGLVYDLCKFGESKKAMYEMEMKVRSGLKPKRAMHVMEMMVMSGLRPYESCYRHLVSTVCRKGGVSHAMQLVEKLEEYGYMASNSVLSTLVRGLAQNRNLNFQIWNRLMRKGLKPDSSSYAVLLEVVAREKGANEAMRVLDEIVANGEAVDLVCYNVLLTAFCNEGRTENAMQLLKELPSKGWDSTYNILLKNLCCEERWEEASMLLADMHEGIPPSIATYNIFIGSLAQQGKVDIAFEVFEEIKRAGLKPITASYNLILAHSCKEGNVDLAIKCLDKMKLEHCHPTMGTHNAIAELCRQGKAPEAFSLIRSLACSQVKPNDEYYDILISSLCKNGNTHPALQLLYEMTKDGFTPLPRTYCHLIHGLCAEGMLGEAVELAGVMEKYGCLPGMDTFNVLIHQLCKANRTDLSLHVFEKMIAKGYKPSEEIYFTLVEGLAYENEMEVPEELLRKLQQEQVITPTTVDILCLRFDLI